MLPRVLNAGDSVGHFLRDRGLLGLWLPLPHNSGGGSLFDLYRPAFGTGTLTGSNLTWTTAPNAGGALQFPASISSYVAVPARAEYDTSPFTILSLFYPTTASQNGGLFERTTTGAVNTGSSLFLSGGSLAFRVVGATAGLITATGGSAAINNWHVGAGTFDGSTLSCYLDGNAPATASLTGVPKSGTGISRIGSLVGFFGFAGRIAAVAYLGSCLSADEVADVRADWLAGFPRTLRRYTPKAWSWGIDGSNSGGGGDVTVALTGQSFTASAGTLTPATAVGLTGSSATASAGTLAPALAKALSGQAATASAGNLSPSLSKSLTGQAITSAAGSLSSAVSVALSGQQITAAQGTVTVAGSGDVTVALTGQGFTASAGNLAPAVSKSLSGQAITSAAGTLAPAVSLSLSGQSFAASPGTLTPGTSVALTGQAAVAATGSLSPAVSVALSGQEVVAATGTVTPSGGTAVHGGGVCATVALSPRVNATASLEVC